MANARRRPAFRPLRARIRHRPRLTWSQALILVAAVSLTAVAGAALLVLRTDPGQFPDLGTALWWAVATVTTVGYGDVVPVSTPGRLVGAALMFVGIGSFAFLTAVAASAIVVGEVGDEERRIERAEADIRVAVEAVLVRLTEVENRLRMLTVPTEAGAEDAAASSRGPLSR
ncbi:potassium channel family protein [Plantactinospora siamensis]|uniref:Potassium channel family protein n=1 Tax=Plantactinospora siamensis TaxID=555372 RepID=A0ABV6P4D1_9ACTN